jgi:diguanylate cyclase (GGDEF)-like protein
MSSPADILVVEDSRVQAKGLQRFLQKHGYQVLLAFNGREGLAAAKECKPRVIMADIVMPVMDGFEMCRAIRADENLNKIPIVMVTSLSDAGDIIRGLEAGADSYVSKPYEEEVLLARIWDALSLSKMNYDPVSEKALEVVFRGKTYSITARRSQILSLLLSTYDDAVRQNVKLRDARADLVVFNSSLETKVAKRTAALQKEITVRRKAEKERLKLIDELMEARDKLHFKATHDELTNHWNRSAILRAMKSELARAKRENRPVGVILMDIDYFKRINDSHGHLAGDAVLREVARRISSVMRPYDAVGRYGGEEFILILPGCDIENTIHVAERLRKTFSGNPIRTKEGVFWITMSFGVTSVQGLSERETDAVIRAADQALYRAKNGGRNRVEV